MSTSKKKPRESIVKFRVSDAERVKLAAYVARLSPPRSLSAWLRDLVWREAGL